MLTLYVRELSSAIKNTTGNARYKKYDELCINYKEKIRKDHIYTRRASGGEKFISPRIEDGAHATRSKHVEDSTTHDDDEVANPIEEELTPASSFMLSAAKRNAEQEVK